MKRATILLILILTTAYLEISGSKIRTISSNEGLSNNAIYCMHQDRYGCLYLGTADGLNIWNGHSMELFQSNDGFNHFSGNTIRAIHPTGQGELILQTNYGIARVDPHKRNVNFYKELAFSQKTAVTEDGNIYTVDNRMHLHYLDVESGRIWHLEGFTETAENCMHILANRNGNVNIFTDKGIYILEIAHNPEPVIRKISRLDIACSHVSHTDDGRNLYIVTKDSRLNAFDSDNGIIETIRELKLPASTSLSDITGILPTRNGYYVSSASNGVFLFENASDEPSITDIKCGVFSMMADKLQPITWIGTDCNGLLRWNKYSTNISCITFDSLPYNIDMPVRSIYLDKERRLWFGTKGEGIYRLNNYSPGATYDKSNVDRYTTVDSELTYNSVYTIMESRHDILWIGNGGVGLNWFSFRKDRIGRVAGGEQLKRIHAIIEQNDSTLWIGTDSEGAYRCRFHIRNGAPVITAIDTLKFISPFNYRTSIFSMSMQSDSTIWFSSRGQGALEYDIRTGESRVIQFPNENGYATNAIFHIAQSDEMLFATGNGTVMYYPKADSLHLSEHVPQKAIHAIVEDSNGNIWISTNSGIISLDANYDYRTSFDRMSSLEVLEYSDGACWHDKESNTVFFGGINGITAIQEKRDINYKSVEYKPSISITNFIQNNEKSHIEEKLIKGRLRIPYSKSIFGIEFLVVDNLRYSDYSFIYQIDGYNEEWIENGNNNVIYLSSLKSGRYKLKIRYHDKANDYISEECSLPIYIIPPIYKRWWAMMIYAIILFIIGFELYRYQKNKYRQAKEKLRRQFSEEVIRIKGETTGKISEELSVLVTFILGLCQDIRTKSRNNPHIGDTVELIEHNVAKINKTLNILNEFRRISENESSSTEVKLVPVSQLTREIAELMTADAKARNIMLESNIESGIILAINQDSFLTMFNLMISKVLNIAFDNTKVNLDINHSNECVCLCFKASTDNESLNRADEFILCERIVSEMGGRMTFRYEKTSENITINITLPQSTMSGRIMFNSEEPLKPTINKNIKPHLESIMLISDNKDVSPMIGYFLSDIYNVLEFNDIESALKEMRTSYPAAIIFDVSMMMDSFRSFIEKTKEDKRISHLPILALTSSLQYTERTECRKLGADQCISFPFNINHLLAALETMLSKRKRIAEYYKSSISTYVLEEGKLLHQDDKVFLDNMINIINENISDPRLSAAMIADKLGISIRVMYRKLENLTSRNLHQIIRDTRMKVAANLLAKSKDTIDEIMYKIGYENRSTFYMNFKNSYKMTPKEYRNSIRNDAEKAFN